MKTVIKTDDLVYDGKNIIIPSYWSDSLSDFIQHVNVNELNEFDKPDFELLVKFLTEVNDHKSNRPHGN